MKKMSWNTTKELLSKATVITMNDVTNPDDKDMLFVQTTGEAIETYRLTGRKLFDFTIEENPHVQCERDTLWLHHKDRKYAIVPAFPVDLEK